MGVRKEKMSKEAVEEEVEKLMASGKSAFDAGVAGMFRPENPRDLK